jgi:hypothetical protein
MAVLCLSGFGLVGFADAAPNENSNKNKNDMKDGVLDGNAGKGNNKDKNKEKKPEPTPVTPEPTPEITRNVSDDITMGYETYRVLIFESPEKEKEKPLLVITDLRSFDKESDEKLRAALKSIDGPVWVENYDRFDVVDKDTIKSFGYVLYLSV